MHFTKWRVEKNDKGDGIAFEESLMSIRQGCNPILRLRVIHKQDGTFEPIVRDHGEPGVMVGIQHYPISDLNFAKKIVKKWQ